MDAGRALFHPVFGERIWSDTLADAVLSLFVVLRKADFETMTADEWREARRMLLQMLFVEGNHFCPSCEKSGNCVLQATAYELKMMSPHFDMFYPDRPVDASHPDVLLDFNRCILCELCVRASRDVDGKSVFALSGRGIQTHLIVNARSGQLGGQCADAGQKSSQPGAVFSGQAIGLAEHDSLIVFEQ